MIKMQKKILIAYNFNFNESHVGAPNFYKLCAEIISCEFNTKVSFIPDASKSIVFYCLLFFRLNKSKASAISNCLWLSCNAYKFDVVVGWSANSIIVGLLKFCFGWSNLRNYMILYKIPSPNKKNSLAFVKRFILKTSLKGTSRLFAVDSAQAKLFEKNLNLEKGFVKTFRYGVDTKFYKKYFGKFKKSNEVKIFSPGGAFRDDITLLKALQRLNVVLYRFQLDDSGITSHKIEFINSVRVEYFKNAPYSTYIKESCSSHFAIISVLNNEVPVGLTSLLECKALGLAVIMTRGTSSIEYINDGIDGLLFRQGDSKDLENKIKYLLNNPRATMRIGEAARKNVEEEFNSFNCARNLFSYID